MTKPKLLILDRDQTINDMVGLYYVVCKEDFKLLPGVKEAFQLLKTSGVPVVLATKQRAISHGLLTWGGLNDIHTYMEELIDFKFVKIYIEEREELKTSIFKDILWDFGSMITPEDMLLIDDSPEQCEAGRKLGMQVICTKNLLETVRNLVDLAGEQ